MIWYGIILAGCAWAAFARGLPPASKRLLRIVALYYFIAYCGRAWLLLTFEPRPGAGTFVADDLLRRPRYADGIDELAPLAALGLWTLVGSVYLASAWLSRSQFRSRVSGSRSRLGWRQSAVLTAALAWPVRIAALLAGTTRPEGLVGRISLLPTVMLGVLILGTDWRRSSKATMAVSVLAAGEAVWSLGTLTKTPILAVFAFLYLDPNRRTLTLRSTMVGVAAVALAFGLVQPNKTDISTADFGGRSYLAPVGRVLVRFDLMRALTVAERHGPGSYLANDELGGRLASAWMPTSLVGMEKTPSGVLWGQRMNGSTSGASLAEGPTAEGYAIAGLPGATLWAAVVGLAVALVGRSLQRRGNFISLVVVTHLIGSNALFERGVLGLNEAFAIGWQLVALTSVPYVLVRAVMQHGLRERARTQVSRDAYSRIAASATG